MVHYSLIENYLEIYSLEEILEQNEVTEAEALQFLVDQEFVKLPDIRPL